MLFYELKYWFIKAQNAFFMWEVWVIYFSVLSLQLIVELKRESKGIKVLSYIGKSNKQIKELVKKQIAGRLLMPMFMPLLVLLFSIPLVNLKLNLLLPIGMHNILLMAAFCFSICFLFFYVCYFFVVYTISKQYVGISNYKKLCWKNKVFYKEVWKDEKPSIWNDYKIFRSFSAGSLILHK